ncbi:MAG: beta-ketoacyl synthase N-terminal-like domain-containing protein [Acidobacteriota bacterium]
MPERVVVPGIGTIGAHGAGLDGVARALASEDARTAPIDRSAAYHPQGGAERALLVPVGTPDRWVPSAAARRMCALSRFAVAAAGAACEDAGIATPHPRDDLGVYLSTSFGAVAHAAALMRAILLDGPQAASPFLFSESVANAPAAQVAIAIGARGPNVTVTQRESGALIALSRAAADVAAGRTSVALAGAVEECAPLLHALSDRFRALARPRDGAIEAARPFDARRDGFLMAEGATILVLESASSAIARGAPIHAELAAWISGFDGTATPVSWGHGHEAFARTLLRGLGRAGIALGGIDRVVSGASGSIAGDRLEARTLRSVFGEDALPPILTPKALLGEYGGAFLAAAALAARGVAIAPCQGLGIIDPACGMRPWEGAPPPPARTVLVSSLAAGGSAAWIVLRAG